MQQSTWFTPEGLEDLLPSQAIKLEYYRRKLLDSFHVSGFDLVLPPLAEFTDSLLTGTAGHMAVDTSRFTDQESGRMMGVRADMTPQVARIVSNRLKADQDITRLCYVGEVLKTRNNKAKGSRSPIQVGAELYGHTGIESDLEMVELMLESLETMHLKQIKVSLGHIAIVTELMQLAEFSSLQINELVDILRRKAIPEYESFLATLSLQGNLEKAFAQLPFLCGPANQVLSKANKLIRGLSSQLDQALDDIETVSQVLLAHRDIEAHLDLSDIRGFQYHTGMIYAAYSSAKLFPIAKGGRYDNIGSVFGLALPATGFSLDLRTALDLLDEPKSSDNGLVYAPAHTDPTLAKKVSQLKAEGYRVIKHYKPTLPEGVTTLIKQDDQWVLNN